MTTRTTKAATTPETRKIAGRPIRTLTFSFAISLLMTRLFVGEWRYLQFPEHNSVQQRVHLNTTSGLRQYQEVSLSQHPGRFAYAFIISGCTDTSCLGYILNSVVAAYIFRDSNSTADVLLMVRMASNHNATRLSPEQESWLEKLGVRLRYLKKVQRDSFGTAVLEKFRVLQLHDDYDRVLFLDADIVPLCNLDYMFHESYRRDGILSDYIAISGSVAQMTAAVFMVKPREGEFRRVIDVVRRARDRSRTSATPGFDPKVGWGHEMVDPDMWQSWWKTGQNWTFYAAQCDQGILYMYFKYMLLNFTQIHPDVIQTWREVTDDVAWWRNSTNVIEVDGGKFLAKVEERKNDALRGCGGPMLGRPHWSKAAPFSDYFHFAGHQKPWLNPISAVNLPTSMRFLEDEKATGLDFWQYFLGRANRTMELNLPSMILVSKGNPLGGWTGDNDLFRHDVELPSRRK